MFCEPYLNLKQQEKELKKQDKVKKLLMHFDEKISERVENFVKETVFEDSKYLFIRKEDYEMYINGVKEKQKRYYAYCTNCNEEYEINKYYLDDIYRHNGYCKCIKCSSRLKTKHTRYGRKKLIDNAVFITYDKSIIDNETIVAKGYFVTRDYTGDYTKVRTKYRELSRYIFSPKGSFMLSEFNEGWYLEERCNSYKCGYQNYREEIDNESIIIAVRNTRFRYSPYKRYMGTEWYQKEDMTRFFYNYNRYPIIEKLVKLGFTIIADNIVYGSSLQGAVNWKSNDIFKFLKINRAEMKEIRESMVTCTPSFLNMFRFIKDEKLKWNIEKIEKISRKYSVKVLKKIKQYSGINKTLNYIEKQECLVKNYYVSLSTWFDYLEDCEKLNLNLKSDNVLYPKKLYDAHQNTIKQIEYEENKKLDEKIRKLKAKREKYKFKYKDLMIRAAESSKELIEEGKQLNHCVGRYIKDFAEGETNILFIRKINAPTIPFYTVEIKNGKVVQIHGKYNSNPTKEIKEFMEQFEKNKLYKKVKEVKEAC